MIAYKFVKWGIVELDSLSETMPYQLKNEVLLGRRLTREKKDILFKALITNAYSKTGIPLQGWMFTFGEILHAYYVEFRHGGHIQKFYAPDKMSIRKELRGIHRIQKVEE